MTEISECEYTDWAQEIFVKYPVYNFVESYLGLHLTGAEKMLLRQSIYEYEPFLKTLPDIHCLYLSRVITERLLDDFGFSSKKFLEYKKKISRSRKK